MTNQGTLSISKGDMSSTWAVNRGKPLRRCKKYTANHVFLCEVLQSSAAYGRAQYRIFHLNTKSVSVLLKLLVQSIKEEKKHQLILRL